MDKLREFFIKYSAWPNAIKLIILIFGIIAAFNLKSSFFPEFDSQMITIQVVYPGSSPEEIERGVVQKIEENLKGIQGIDRFTSKSKENTASITVEVKDHYNTDDVLQDVKNAVGRINSFPVGMEPAVVFKNPKVDFAISFALYGKVDLKTLKRNAQKIEDDLRNLKGISQISIEGYPVEEISIYIKEDVLKTYNITFDQVSRAVQQSNLDLSLGSIKTRGEEILLRLKNKKYYAEGLEDIVIKSAPDGSVIRLRDVASIKNTWADNPRRTYLNGKKSVIITVSKILGENYLDIVQNVKDYLKDYNRNHQNLQVEILRDRSISLNQRINLLLRNGLWGALLVLLALALFLNFRLAFWVALGIPFAFLGMMLVMYLAGVTINVISLFGCIIVIGILVDDGIVISESIYQFHEKGFKPYIAAIKGVKEVISSVVFSILTTIVAFLPFFFLAGSQGKNMRDMAFVVIITIVFSLLEATFILPSHLAHSKALRTGFHDSSFRQKLNKIILYPRDVWYKKSLKFFLKNWILVIAFGIFITLATIGAFMGGVIGTTFFPFMEFDSFDISLVMPAGTRVEKTKKILERIEKATWEVNQEFKAKRKDHKDIIKNVIVHTAKGPRGLFGATSEANGNVGTVEVVMLNGEERNMDSYIIKNAIKKKVGPVYDAEQLNYGAGSIFGKPVSFALVSPNLNDLENATEDIKTGLKKIKDLRDVQDDSPEGFREIEIQLKDKAYLLGLTPLEIARQIRQGFFGNEIQRLQRGKDEIKVWVRYTDKDRSSIKKLENSRIRIPGKSEIPLSELITYTIKRGPTVINHVDGNRLITVDADLVNTEAEVPPILSRATNEVLNPVLKKYPSVRTVESGQQREIMKTARSSRTGLSIAFVIIFFLIVLSFRSYTQAIVVILLVPLGLIGASWGHFIHGIPVNMMSAYGIIALIGIIVNNSIVFINTVNQYLQQGMDFDKAIVDAAINRFRPILLTTVTTVLGLLPLVTETSRQAQFLIPMAISLSYGLLLGATFTLIFLPVYLKILNRIKLHTKRFFTGKELSPNDVEPAVKEIRQLEKNFGDELVNNDV